MPEVIEEGSEEDEEDTEESQDLKKPIFPMQLTNEDETVDITKP